MANMHILQMNGNYMRVVRHIAIPATNNGAGISWQTAVVNSGLGGTTSLKDGDGTAGTIAAAEKTSIQGGSILEQVTEIYLPSGLSGAQIAALLDADFTANSAAVLAQIQATLNQYGRTR